MVYFAESRQSAWMRKQLLWINSIFQRDAELRSYQETKTTYKIQLVKQLQESAAMCF